MKVTRDVILDLLPTYLAGEASADTRDLVQEFLAQDPELARLAETRGEDLLAVELPDYPQPEDEMRAIEKTKKLLAWRGYLAGAAIFFTFLPFSFYANDEGTRTLWRTFPSVAGAALVVAVGLWVALLAVRHRLRTTGW
jgi:hypothetical protein